MKIHLTLVALLAFTAALAQTGRRLCGPAPRACTLSDSVTIGTVDTYNSSPFRGAEASGSRRQFLVSKDELALSGLAPGGVLRSFSVRVSSNRPNVYRSWTLGVACVDSSVTTINRFYPTTQVYSADSVNPDRGWVRFPFSGNGYVWDGHSGLVFEFCFQNPTANNTVEDSVAGTTISNKVWVVNATDGSSPCASTSGGFTFAFRPQIRLHFCAVDTVTGIAPTHLQEAAIYPNPTGGAFAVRGLRYPYQADVYDAQGRRVLTRQVISEANATLQLDTPGLYILRTDGIDGRRMFKVLVGR